MNQRNIKRAAERDKASALFYLESLFELFKQAKTMHTCVVDGILIIDTELTDLKNQLQLQWIDYCSKFKSKAIDLNPYALRNKIEQNLNSHRELVYAGYAMKVLEEKYGYDGPEEEYDFIIKMHKEGISPDDACINVVNQINTVYYEKQTKHAFHCPKFSAVGFVLFSVVSRFNAWIYAAKERICMLYRYYPGRQCSISG